MIPERLRKGNMRAEKWSELYKHNKANWTTEPEKDLVKLAGEIKSPVLDFGCGNGRNSIYLSKLGFGVVAIDSSEGAIKTAKELSAKEGQNNIKYVVGNENDINGKFNFIMCLGVLHGNPRNERKRIIDKFLDCLNREGKCLISVFSERDPTFSPLPENERRFHDIPVHLSSKRELLGLMSGFNILKIYEKAEHEEHGYPHKHALLVIYAQKR